MSEDTHSHIQTVKSHKLIGKIAQQLNLVYTRRKCGFVVIGRVQGATAVYLKATIMFSPVTQQQQLAINFDQGHFTLERAHK